VACLEEIAFRQGLISADRLLELGRAMNNPYGAYLIETAQRAR